MVETTTLDDYLLPRLKLRRDDAFDAHIKVSPTCVGLYSTFEASPHLAPSRHGLQPVIDIFGNHLTAHKSSQWGPTACVYGLCILDLTGTASCQMTA